MSLPKSVSILGREWEVRTEERSEEDLRCFGETEMLANVIHIYTRPHGDYPHAGSQQATLFHECIHAALATSGMSALIKGKVEEALIRVIEEGVFPLVAAGVFQTNSQTRKRGGK